MRSVKVLGGFASAAAAPQELPGRLSLPSSQPRVLAAFVAGNQRCTRNGEASTRRMHALDPNWCLLSDQHLPVLPCFQGLRQKGDN